MITSEDINFFFGIISPKVICWFYFSCSSDIGSIPLWRMCRRNWKKVRRGKHQGKFWKPRILGKCEFECMWPRAPLHLQYIDLAKPKSRARIFFSRTSQGHNALPQPGLEPGSSNSEPSALTTGLLNKAVKLVCPWYNWPGMLKVALCTVVRSYIQIFSAWWVTTIFV